jgi:hypothetical protein
VNLTDSSHRECFQQSSRISHWSLTSAITVALIFALVFVIAISIAINADMDIAIVIVIAIAYLFCDREIPSPSSTIFPPGSPSTRRDLSSGVFIGLPSKTAQKLRTHHSMKPRV